MTATSPTSIRPAVPDDAPAIVRFQQSMALETEDKPLDADLAAAVFADPLK